MTSQITVLIPVSSYHIDRVPAALASVRAQTLPCEVAIFYDEDGKGAGYARNQLLKLCKTPLCIFLDADDLLKPSFAERTFALYQQSGRYIFCDWDDEHGKRYGAPDCAWVNGTHHLITTLLPTDWVRAIGGFDESMAVAEDSDLYVHLNTSGYCGMHLAETLVTYTHYGQRSQNGLRDALLDRAKARIQTKYRGKVMGCCNDAPISPPAPMGERVLVMPKWGLGTRNVIGQATGVQYGRLDASTPPVLMDRRDVAIRPDLFAIIETPKAPDPTPEVASSSSANFKRLVAQLSGVWADRPTPPAPRVYVPTPAPVVDAKPDFERVLRLAQQVAEKDGRTFDVQSTSDGIFVSNISRAEIEAQSHSPIPSIKLNADPVFVFPDKEYPSYTDVRRLVELSGFETISMSQAYASGYPDRISIILSPEQPDISMPISNKVIWWVLEYGGEYEPNFPFSPMKSENIWASDPAWAAAHGAKLVVMGSHPDLNLKVGGNVSTADVIMLAYMTHRRQIIREALSDLRWWEHDYPGYGLERHGQLASSHLMLHAHQDDARRAIAPQRFALCAAYHLLLIHEAVPDAGAYADYARFEPYENLAAATRDEVRGVHDDPLRTSMGERLYHWLCVEHTFRKSVEEALRD